MYHIVAFFALLSLAAAYYDPSDSYLASGLRAPLWTGHSLKNRCHGSWCDDSAFVSKQPIAASFSGSMPMFDDLSLFSGASGASGLSSVSAFSGSMTHSMIHPSAAPVEIVWTTQVGPELPPIIRTYYKPGLALGSRTYVPGQDYKIYYYDDGDLLKKQIYYAGDDYDVNLFREGDVFKKMVVKSGDDIDIDAFVEGNKYYDKNVFVEGTRTVDTGRGEDMFYKEKPSVIKDTHITDSMDTGLDFPKKSHMVHPASGSNVMSLSDLNLAHVSASDYASSNLVSDSALNAVPHSFSGSNVVRPHRPTRFSGSNVPLFRGVHH